MISLKNISVKMGRDQVIRDKYSGTVVHPATRVLCGGYNETCAALGQVPTQWWSVPVACLVPPSVCCHCGVVVVVKHILYTFLDPCLCFT
jgi:hypothetical protein